MVKKQQKYPAYGGKGKNGYNQAKPRIKGIRNISGPGSTRLETGLLLLRDLAEFALLDALVSYLFYRSWIVWLVLLILFPYYCRERKKERLRIQKEQMCAQFLTAIQLTATSLRSGNAIENAFADALGHLRKIYPEESFIVISFSGLVGQLHLNVPAEKLLLEFGRNSGVEDIADFAEVFDTARRTGGDLISVVTATMNSLRQKEETRREIETVLAGKQMEQRMMSVIPLFIIGYVSFTSPGFLDAMYHNIPGALIMTGCLAVYGGAVLWLRRIMTIEI